MSHLRRRRNFLKLSVAAAGALLPGACYRDALDPAVLSEEARECLASHIRQVRVGPFQGDAVKVRATWFSR